MSFQTSRHIPTSPEAVFRAFADPQRLARWWGPAGFTNTFHSIDFTAGGQWKYTMHGPDGTSYQNESVFEEVVPDSKVVIRHLSKPNYTLTITLARSDQGTEVSWLQSFDDPRFEPAMRHVIEPANEQNLDRLAAEVGAGGR
jgi:uncharacterized protein YndB with AHSA1/START domain